MIYQRNSLLIWLNRYAIPVKLKFIEEEGGLLKSNNHRIKNGWSFFNQEIISLMAARNIRFTASAPFARFTELKNMIQKCNSWSSIDERWSYFETAWKPKS